MLAHRAAPGHQHHRVLRHRRHHRRRRHLRPGRCAAAGHRPGAVELDPELRRRPEACRLPHPRRPREGEQEVRPEEGPQGSAVLQAVNGVAQARFGTDGVRGVANGDLTAELAVGARTGRRPGPPRPGPSWSGATPAGRARCCRPRLSAGLAAEGADVVDLGVLPTPGVAFLVRASEAPGGDGLGLAQPLRGQRDQALRRRRAPSCPWRSRPAIEREIDLRSTARAPAGRATGTASVGRSTGGVAATSTAITFAASLGGRRLDGLRVVLDCANGAAVGVAPEVFAGLGAEVTSIACEPDGDEYQSTAAAPPIPKRWPARWSRPVPTWVWPSTATPTDCIAVDHHGAVVDGDALLAALRRGPAARGELPATRWSSR